MACLGLSLPCLVPRMKPLALLLLLVAGPVVAGVSTPATFSVQHRYPLGGGGGWDYLTIEPATHRLFIARDDRVMVVDTTNGHLLGEIPGMHHAHGVALVPATQRGYVSNGDSNSVSVIDLRTLKLLTSIPLSGRKPDAIVYDPTSGHVLTMNGHSGTASVIDPASNKEIASIPLPGKPEFAVSDGRGHVFVNIEDKSELARIDTRTNKVEAVWNLAPCESPSGLAYDARHRRLFSVCHNRWMVVTDAASGRQVARLAIGLGPDAARFDPVTRLAYSANHDGTLTVVQQDDADHYRVVANVATAIGARTMALDHATHQVWLVSANPAARGAPVTGFTALVVGR